MTKHLTTKTRGHQSHRQDKLLRYGLEFVSLFLAVVAASLAAAELASFTGFASPVWPAAGIAIAALAARRISLWPAVFVASWLVNFWQLLELQDTSATVQLLLPCSIAVGSTLQAVVAALAIRRFIAQPLALVEQQDIFRLLIIVPLACVVSTSIGNAALVQLGLLASNELLFSWLTWWTGDTVGAFIMIPLVLTFIGQPRENWRNRKALAGMLVILLAVCSMISLYISNQEQERIEQDFVSQADRESLTIKTIVESYRHAVYPMAGLFGLKPDTDIAEFNYLAGPVLAQYPGMMALSFNPIIKGQQREKFERQIRELGYENFQIKVSDGNGQFTRAADKTSYIPILYLHPEAPNRQVIGYDLSSNPVRAAALEAAKTLGAPAATARIVLVQETGNQYGFLLAMPIYSPEQQAANESDEPLGYITAVFRTRDMLAGALGSYSNEQRFRFSLFDRSAAPSEQALCMDCLNETPRLASLFNSNLQLRRNINIGGRNWELELTASHEYLHTARSWQAWLILMSILLFSGFICLFLLEATGRQVVISRKVKLRTAQLARGKELLEHSNAELSRFAHATSHDLKEPLRKISMFSGLISHAIKNGDSEKALDMLDRSQRSSVRLANMIQQLLAYAEVTATAVNFRPINLNGILADVKETLELQINETVATINAEPLPTVQGDQLQLSRVFQNLLSNAMNYRRDDHPPIITISAKRQENDFWQICIADNGEGFDEQYAEKIFQAFQRLHGVTARSGSGIGLSIARAIMNAHGGKLWAESNGKEGASFYLLLPALTKTAETDAVGISPDTVNSP